MFTRSLIVLLAALCGTGFAVAATPGPVPIDGSRLPVTIDRPGSYVLVADLDCRGAPGDCVLVLASDVHLDLGGFAIRDAPGAGVSIDAVEGVSVVRGYVSGNGGAGIMGSKSAGIRLEGVHARSNGSSGFVLGEQAIVDRCAAAGNHADGFVLGEHSRVLDSAATRNAGVGFLLHADVLATECVAARNGRGGFEAARSARGVVLEGCTARENQGHGISVANGCVVRNSTAEANRSAGVHASGAENRIDGNHVAGNDVGILVEDSINLVVRNSATSNGDNYDIVSCNDVGPIGFASGATNPWANVEH